MGDSQGDFNRFVKNFSTRLIQTVVQSRLGRPTDTPCSQPTDDKDWFSFKVDELGEVAAYIGQSLQRFPPSIDCFTLEFILYTASGDYLPLEEWQVSVDRDDKDPDVSMSNLYHQLGVLLRSCSIAARMTPLSRYYVKKQSSESFVVLYRILDTSGSANESSDEYVVRQLAKLPSPYGSLSVILFFKQKVETTPRKSSSPSPSNEIVRPSSYASAIPVEGSERVEASPVSDHLHVFRGSPATPVSQKAPSTLSDQKAMDDSVCSSSDDEAGPFRGPCQCHYGSGISLPNMVEKASNERVKRNSSSSASFPFAVLLSSSKCKCSLEKINSPPSEPTLVEEEKRPESTHSVVSEESESDSEEEDSSPDPLASAKIFSISPSTSQIAPGTNLGEFLEQCRHAPVDGIHGVTENPNLIKNQIDEFASHINDFDHFVKEVEERVDHD